MVIIRIDRELLQGVPAGEYDIEDPRLKGRGIHWVTQGWAVVVSSDEPQSDTEDKPVSRRKKVVANGS